MAPKFKRAFTQDEYTTEKIDVIQNRLLGDYNANGIYVINKKIVNELLEMQKTKRESYNNEIFCTSETNSGRIIDFEIEFKKNSTTNLAVAELSVLEGVQKQGGRMMNVIKTPISKFTSEITPDFVDRALKRYNVFYDSSDEGQNKKEVDDEYIVKRNMLLNYLNQMSAESINIIYEDYFTQRINLLKQTNNAYTKKILAIFNEEFDKISEYFVLDKKSKKVTNYKAMNEILDKAFEDLSGLEQYEESEKAFKERVLPILSMFITGAERIESSAKKSVLETVPKRFKEVLTEPLLDIKQANESRLEPTVKEANKEILAKEIESKIGKVEKATEKRAEQAERKTEQPEIRTKQPAEKTVKSMREYIAEEREKETNKPHEKGSEQTSELPRDSSGSFTAWAQKPKIGKDTTNKEHVIDDATMLQLQQELTENFGGGTSEKEEEIVVKGRKSVHLEVVGGKTQKAGELPQTSKRASIGVESILGG